MGNSIEAASRFLAIVDRRAVGDFLVVAAAMEEYLMGIMLVQRVILWRLYSMVLLFFLNIT